MSDPRELFLHELQDIYYAENTITKALPTMISEAGDDELVEGLEKHLDETKDQIKVLDQVFEQIGEKAKGERVPRHRGAQDRA